MSAIPKTAPKPEKKPRYSGPFQYYVDAAAAPGGDGSAEHPFATLTEARQAVRTALTDQSAVGPLAVCVRAGTYPTRGFSLSAEDSGREDRPVYWIAEEGAVLHAGFSLPADRFVPASGPIAERMPENGKNIVMIDLRSLGLTEKDWGILHPFSGTAPMYDSYKPGADAALYFNGLRMTTARYPDKGEFLYIENVLDQGEVAEYPPVNYFEGFEKIRNPRPGTIIVDKKTCNRMKTWASTEGVWMFGYFYHDWYELSTPIKSVRLENRLVTPEYNSNYGYRIGARYYFYNIPEELDQPGEWYLDHATGMLYLYPPASMEGADISLAVNTSNIIGGRGAAYVTIDGFKLTGTLGDAISMVGSHLSIQNCHVTAISGSAIVMGGNDNVIRDCEVSHVGRGGIVLYGGDRKTLTHANNRAENNVIHDWSEIKMTCTPAFSIQGVGNICAHNEMYNSPHIAIMYGGNDHLIEYNLIHDVVMLSTDAGAIYSGRDWLANGTVLRYNVLYNIGQEPNNPDGIYFDDALCGQTAYGNLMVNVRKYGFLIGGGRENKVFGNIIIGCRVPIFFDDRCREGLLRDGWYHASIKTPGEGMWEALKHDFIRSGIWAERYPLLAKIHEDYNRPDDIDFGANPSYCVVEDNVIVCPDNRLGEIADAAWVYSSIKNNYITTEEKDIGFTDAEHGDYTIRPDSPIYQMIPGFKNIPLHLVGRI